MGITGLIIAGVIGSVLSATAGIVGSALNYNSMVNANKVNKEATEATNATNLEIATANNETQLDLAKNGYSYRVKDLANAGLNPVLAAQGMTQPTATLSTPTMQAPKMQAPMLDMNGVASAITAMNNTLLSTYLMEQRKDIAGSYQSNAKAISEDRNSVLRDLYKRKGISMNNASDVGRIINSAKQISDATKDNGEWESILKELKQMKYKYNFRR